MSIFSDPKIVFLVILAAALILFLITAALPYSKASVTITSGKKKVSVIAEIADNPAKQARGLMFRKELGENEGMIFIFGNDSVRSFWMMNTLIPLDLIFAAKNGSIVDIKENFAPGTLTPYRSEPASYVLEVNAGFVKKHGIKEGDIMRIG